MLAPIVIMLLLLPLDLVVGADVDWESASLSDMYDNCEPLADDLHVWWTMDRPKGSVWFALEGAIATDDYMAFGVSGADDRPEMHGADVVVADFQSGSARARDFSLPEAIPCDEGRRAGSCPDVVLNAGAHDDVDRVFGAMYRDAAGCATVVHYRRPIAARDPDLDRPLDGGNRSVVFAIGSLGANGFPTGHRTVPAQLRTIDFGRAPTRNCAPLMAGARRLQAALQRKTDRQPAMATAPKAIAIGEASHRFTVEPVSDRVLVFSLGPSGVEHPSVVYYVNGRPSPVLRLQRGLDYTFQVMTGLNATEPTFFHPLVVRAAGAGAPQETVIGPAQGRLCLWSSSMKRSDLPADFATFRRSLAISCDAGPFDYFHWTPDADTPSALQYASTEANGTELGARIEIVDS